MRSPRRGRARAALGAGALAAALSLSGVARASGPTVTWNPTWPRFQLVEGVDVATLAVVTGYLVVASPEQPGWRGTNRFDDGVRRALRSTGPTGRYVAARASDAIVTALMLNALAIDPAVALGPDKSTDVAQQIFAIDAESLVMSLALQTLLVDAVGRERPFGRLCDTPQGDPGLCAAKGRYRSFYSGHTTMAFTSAALACTTHGELALYHGAWDGFACGAAMTLAATVGALRIVADRHYASDVLTGAAIGLFSGLAVPRLLHYRDEGPPSAAVASAASPLRRATFVPTFASTF
jgi:hypothetical protein